MKKYITLLAALLITLSASGCAISKKYVEFNMEEGSCILVEGGIEPSFMREGTTEGQEPSNKVDLKAQLTDKILD